jgi:hypothetical protein
MANIFLQQVELGAQNNGHFLRAQMVQVQFKYSLLLPEF